MDEVKNLGGRPPGMTKATIERRKFIIEQLKKGKLPSKNYWRRSKKTNFRARRKTS